MSTKKKAEELASDQDAQRVRKQMRQAELLAEEIMTDKQQVIQKHSPFHCSHHFLLDY